MCDAAAHPKPRDILDDHGAGSHHLIVTPADKCYKWVEKRCMNSTILAAVLCNSVQRVIRSAPSRAGT